MAFKSMQEFKEQTKGLNEKQLKEFLDNLSDDEQAIINIAIDIQHRVNYIFRDDDYTDYTDDEQELNERMETIKNAINGLNKEDLYYTKESLTENNYILRVLAHCIKDTDRDLDADRLNTLIDRYNTMNDFINSDKNHDEILGFYGDIVYKDDNGFYKVNDAIANKILRDNDLNVTDKDDLEDVKDAIGLTWENKKEILDPNEINDISEKQNGINFKQFIFCEEYLKRGKIKPTCEHLGISRNTAYLWLDDTKVQEYLKKRQDEIKKETDDTFIQTYRASFSQLNKMINSKGIDTTDKIKAIDVFLKHYENIERLKQPQTTYED